MSEGYEDTQTLMITNPMAALSPTVRSTTIETIVDRVYAELERRIVTCELAPGSLLSEAELSMQLNVSRTPVGEALQRLAREGLVNILPRRGILVTDISVSEQVQLLEFRRDVSRLMPEPAPVSPSHISVSACAKLPLRLPRRDVRKMTRR